MSLPAWPTSVRDKPIGSSWSIVKPFVDPVSTEMTGGNVRLRAQPGNNVAIISQTIRMTVDQYTTFETFYRTTLNNGTSRFTMSVWTGAAYATKTVQFVVGQLSISKPTFLKVEVAMQLRVYGM